MKNGEYTSIEVKPNLVEQNSYDLVDLLKFIGSIMIFLMHINTLDDFPSIGRAFDCLAQWGVPFFFITSSYFLFSKSVNGNITIDTLKKYVKRILILIFVYSIINIPSIIYYRLIVHGITNIGTWLTFFKESAISSTFMGSWYLNSSIFCAILLFLMLKKFNIKTILVISGIIRLISMLSTVEGILPQNIYNILVFLCFPLNSLGGLFYFVIGKILFDNRKLLFKVSNIIYILIFTISYVYFFACFNGYIVSLNIGIGVVSFSTALVIIAFKSNIVIKNSLLLRKLSTIIYCGQGNVLLVSGFIKTKFTTNYLTKAIIGLILISLFSLLVLYLQKSKKFKWSGYLT